MGSEVRSLSREASLDYVIERLKNMNPLIRLCGLKRSHRLRDLTGDVERAAGELQHLPPMWWLIAETYHWTVAIAAAVLRLSTDLQYARIKSATGNLLNVWQYRQANRGRSAWDAKGAQSRWPVDWRSLHSSPRWGKPITWRRKAVQSCLQRKLPDH